MRKSFGKNRHQKAAHKVGERRAGREQIEELLEMARSDDPEARAEAAEYLCPCHVRRRIEAAWEALYRMLEDPDVRVRRAAWHTLEDGGRPDDPALDALLERGLARETDERVLRLLRQVAGPRREEDLVRMRLAGRNTRQRGKCDFCGAIGVFVEPDYRTPIPAGNSDRAARICESCAKTL